MGMNTDDNKEDKSNGAEENRCIGLKKNKIKNYFLVTSYTSVDVFNQ